MAARHVFMHVRDHLFVFDQGHRAGRGCRLDDEDHRSCQTIVLKRLKSGRGERSKIEAGSP